MRVAGLFMTRIADRLQQVVKKNVLGMNHPAGFPLEAWTSLSVLVEAVVLRLPEASADTVPYPLQQF